MQSIDSIESTELDFLHPPVIGLAVLNGLCRSRDVIQLNVSPVIPENLTRFRSGSTVRDLFHRNAIDLAS